MHTHAYILMGFNTGGDHVMVIVFLWNSSVQ